MKYIVSALCFILAFVIGYVFVMLGETDVTASFFLICIGITALFYKED